MNCNIPVPTDEELLRSLESIERDLKFITKLLQLNYDGRKQVINSLMELLADPKYVRRHVKIDKR